MVNMADLSSEQVRQVHKDTGSGSAERHKTGEAFTVDLSEMKSKEGKKTSLQESFLRFRKQRQKEIRDERRLRDRCLRKQGDVEHMNKLRRKFLKRTKKYYGIPYARRYWTPDKPEYKSGLFLDCCGLVRQVMRDLRKDFGFRLGPWNQAYMYDTLPITVEREEDMKPGDLVFMSGTYPRPNARQQKHLMTHVEIWVGDGTKTIGSRWNNGKVQMWDDYRFEAKSFQDAKYHFKSIDTWLQGVCRSFCPEHKWRRSFAPCRKSIFAETPKQKTVKQKDNRQKPVLQGRQRPPEKESPSPPVNEERQEQGDDELEEEEEEEEEDEPACDSEEERLEKLSGDDPKFLVSPHMTSSEVKFNCSNKFPKRQAYMAVTTTPTGDSDDESEDDELSIGGRMARLNFCDTAITTFGALRRSHTDILPGQSSRYYDQQRQMSQSAQELPTRFPIIVNDVGRNKPVSRGLTGYERMKTLSDRCLATPRSNVPTKQDAVFQTRKKSLEEKRQIFQDLEQSESILVIDNSDDIKVDDSTEERDIAPPQTSSAATEESEDQLNAMEGRSDSESDFNVAKDEVNGAKDEVSGAKDEVNGAKDEVNGAKDEVSGAKDEVNGAKDEVNGAKDEVNGAKDEVNGAKDEVNGAKDEVNGAKDEVNGAKDEVSGAKDEVNGAKDEVNGAKDEVNGAIKDEVNGDVVKFDDDESEDENEDRKSSPSQDEDEIQEMAESSLSPGHLVVTN